MASGMWEWEGWRGRKILTHRCTSVCVILIVFGFVIYFPSFFRRKITLHSLSSSRDSVSHTLSLYKTAGYGLRGPVGTPLQLRKVEMWQVAESQGWGHMGSQTPKRNETTRTRSQDLGLDWVWNRRVQLTPRCLA